MVPSTIDVLWGYDRDTAAIDVWGYDNTARSYDRDIAVWGYDRDTAI